MFKFEFEEKKTYFDLDQKVIVNQLVKFQVLMCSNLNLTTFSTFIKLRGMMLLDLKGFRTVLIR